MRNAFKHLLGVVLLTLLTLRRMILGRRRADEPGKVVLLADIGLGNAVMALPLLRSLRLNRPAMEIIVLASPSAAVIFTAAGLADRVIVLKSSAIQRVRQAAALRREAIDLCLVTFPTLSMPQELLPLWLGARENRIHDYRPIQPYFHYLLPLYSVPAAIDYSLHDVEQNLTLLPAHWKIDTGYPSPAISPRSREAAAGFLKKHGATGEAGYFAMHPGGKRGADYKRWPAAQFRALAGEIFGRFGAPTVAILGPDEREMISSLEAPFLIPLVTNDLEITIAVLEKSRYFISNDSGLMHVASLLGRPQMAIWGATDPRRNRAWNPHAVNLFNESVPCWPCIRFIPTGAHRSCLRECLAGVTVTAAMGLLVQHLSQFESGRHPLP